MEGASKLPCPFFGFELELSRPPVAPCAATCVAPWVDPGRLGGSHRDPVEFGELHERQRPQGLQRSRGKIKVMKGFKLEGQIVINKGASLNGESRLIFY